MEESNDEEKKRKNIKSKLLSVFVARTLRSLNTQKKAAPEERCVGRPCPGSRKDAAKSLFSVGERDSSPRKSPSSGRKVDDKRQR